MDTPGKTPRELIDEAIAEHREISKALAAFVNSHPNDIDKITDAVTIFQASMKRLKESIEAIEKGG